MKRVQKTPPFRLVTFDPAGNIPSGMTFNPWTMKDIYESPTIKDKIDRGSKAWFHHQVENETGFKYLPFGGDTNDVYPDYTNVVYEGKELVILANVPFEGLEKVHDTKVDFIDHNFLCLSIDINPKREITDMICPLLEYEVERGMGHVFLAIELSEARGKVKIVDELFKKLKLPMPQSPLRTQLAAEKSRINELDQRPIAKLFEPCG